mgnify:CR=1 FL=1
MSCSPTCNTLEINETRFTNAQMARLLDASCGMVFGDVEFAVQVFEMMGRLDAQAAFWTPTAWDATGETPALKSIRIHPKPKFWLTSSLAELP